MAQKAKSWPMFWLRSLCVGAVAELLGTSALSQLNFGIDGFEFTAGIVDSHLPVDAALSGVDIV